VVFLAGGDDKRSIMGKHLCCHDRWGSQAHPNLSGLLRVSVPAPVFTREPVPSISPA
jgi:hypothetical protein